MCRKKVFVSNLIGIHILFGFNLLVNMLFISDQTTRTYYIRLIIQYPINNLSDWFQILYAPNNDNNSISLTDQAYLVI